MRRGPLGRKPLILLSVLLMWGTAFTAEQTLMKFHGVVMDVDLKTNVCVVNEKQVHWFSYTSLNNEKGVLASIENLKVKDWVYVEGVNSTVNKRIEARRMPLLSKRTEENEKGFYPFIK